LNRTFYRQQINLNLMKHQLFLCFGLTLAPLMENQAQAAFTQISVGNIVTDTGDFANPSWADFGNRGFLDLIVSDYLGDCLFYRNNGDGSFSKVNQGALVQNVPYRTGAPAADYDNDGHLDVAVIVGADAPSSASNLLFHANGDGTFKAVSGGDIAKVAGFYNTGNWTDYDHDGFVDLLVAQADANGVARPSVLFHNNGDGTFSSIADKGAIDPIDSSSMAWIDYDGDGFDDLIISPAGDGQNLLYRNNQDGSFTRILTNAVATDTWSDGGWTPTWGDYDNDGLPDLFIAGMRANNRPYHNDGNGAFTPVEAGPMLEPPPGGGSRACGWGDYDNDGYLDLFVASSNAPNRLFHNNGDGTFTDVTDAVLSSEPNAGVDCQTVSWVDYDNDGFLDLFVTRFPDDGVATNLLYRNETNSNGWLKVRLIGTVSNRSAIGAKVRVHATVGGKGFWQVREISTGGGRWVPILGRSLRFGKCHQRGRGPGGMAVRNHSGIPQRRPKAVAVH
jgi:hypothetical protein